MKHARGARLMESPCSSQVAASPHHGDGTVATKAETLCRGCLISSAALSRKKSQTLSPPINRGKWHEQMMQLSWHSQPTSVTSSTPYRLCSLGARSGHLLSHLYLHNQCCSDSTYMLAKALGLHWRIIFHCYAIHIHNVYQLYLLNLPELKVALW